MRAILLPDGRRPRQLLKREGPAARWLVAAAAGPVLYGFVGGVVLWLYSAGDGHNEIVHDIEMWLLVLKMPAVIGLIFLCVWSGRALGRGGRLWLIAAGLWTVLGVAAVALYGSNHGRVVLRLLRIRQVRWH